MVPNTKSDMFHDLLYVAFFICHLPISEVRPADICENILVRLLDIFNRFKMFDIFEAFIYYHG